MGDVRRSWFPVAALGFALLVMVVVELVPDTPVTGSFVSLYAVPMTPDNQLYGTGGVGGTGLSAATTATAVHPAALGWLAGLASVVLVAAGWYWLSLRRLGTSPRTGRFVLGTLGALAAVPVLDLVGALQFRLDGDVRGPLIATLGLVLLAGFERSLLLLAVAVVFALLTVVFLPPVAGALAAAGVLFAVAFAALLLRPRDTAGAP
ncbi:hypothetical protein GCM10027258_52450 [Amycolatopsis stemonae]